MKSLLFLHFSLALAIFCCLENLSAQEPTQSVQTFNLQPGPYDVGFKTIRIVDEGRYTDVDPVFGLRPREIVSLVWYPAEANEKDKPVLYGDYVYLDALKQGQREITENWKAVIRNRYLVGNSFVGLTSERLDNELYSSTWARWNSKKEKGTFPLVVYSPGGFEPAWDNSVLAEYLASWGYIVAAIPSRGWYSTNALYPTGYTGLAALVGDFERLLAELRTWKEVDSENVAAMGFSWGGLTNILLQMRDPSIDALVCLDGSIGYWYENNPNLFPEYSEIPGSLADTGFGQPNRMDVPLLFLGVNPPTEWREILKMDQSFLFWEQIKYSTAYQIIFENLHHQDFTSTPIRFGPLWAEIGPPRPQELKNRSYESISLYVRNFLDAYLKSNDEAKDYLQKSPEDIGLYPEIVTITRKTPIGPAPTMTAFRRIIEKHGFAAADNRVAEILRNDPGWMLPPPDLINWGWTLLAEGRCQNAVNVMQVGLRLHPENAEMHLVMAEAQLASGNLADARSYFEQAAALDENNPYAKSRLTRLENDLDDRMEASCLGESSTTATTKTGYDSYKKEGRASTNGLEIYFRTFGRGEPLLLIHGFNLTGRMWEPYIETFGAKYQLIIPDMRGHGQSTNPKGEFTHKLSAEDMLALLDELGINQCRALGFSSGAGTLLEMAVLQPESLEAMVLVDGAHRFSDEAREILRGFDFDTFQENMPWWANTTASWHEDGFDQSRRLAANVRGMGTNPNDLNLPIEQVSNIDIPSLLIFGDKDDIVPIDVVAELHNALPNSKLWIMPDVGHEAVFAYRFRPAEDPCLPCEAADQIFPSTVLQFLEDL